jgi:hypothetical protein
MSHEHEHGHDLPDEPPRWLDLQANRDKVFHSTWVLWLISIGVSFLPYEKHPHMPFEQLPFFSAVFGLGCYIGLVLSAAKLREPLARDEDYYE